MLRYLQMKLHVEIYPSNVSFLDLAAFSHKKVLWKYAYNLQENTHAESWFP